jgi:DNA invertase Pin-like site-specific DNA recombinase
MNATIYRRVSTEKQNLGTQEKICFDYAALKGFEVPPENVFDDEDTSGTIPLARRRGGSRLLARIQASRGQGDGGTEGQGDIQHVIVSKLDRLGRNAEDLLRTVRQFTEIGVCVHFVDMGGEILTTQGPIGKMMLTMLAGFAEFERNMIVTRISDRMKVKRDRNELCGTVPYGWNAVPTGQITPKGIAIRVMEENPIEQGWLRHMLKLRRAGLSYARIAQDLNSRSVPSKMPAGTKIKDNRGRERLSSGLWSQGNVQHVLQNKHTQGL